MGLHTIRQVSADFNVSTRTLRYYEQIGLLRSVKTDAYAYRAYDEEAITRLQQVLVLRKLRISLKQIAAILQSEDTACAIDVFQKSLCEIEDEITALSTIRTILEALVHRLNQVLPQNIKLDLLGDKSLLQIIHALTVTKTRFKEEKPMEDLDKAHERLSKLNDVRILYLPPATIAGIRCVGGQPENDSADLRDGFVREHHLLEVKPDVRVYGFNHPNGVLPDGSDHGYEFWITIPDDMEVKPPFVKKKFGGGMYAAHMIPFGSFEEWQWLFDWVGQSEKYAFVPGDHDCMDGLLEEHLNFIGNFALSPDELYKALQLDLLIPVKQKIGGMAEHSSV